MKSIYICFVVALVSLGYWGLAISEAIRLNNVGTVIFPAVIGTGGLLALSIWLTNSYRKLATATNDTNHKLLAQNKLLSADVAMYKELNRMLSDQNDNLTSEMLTKVATMQQTVDMYEKSLHDQIEKLDAVVPKEK